MATVRQLLFFGALIPGDECHKSPDCSVAANNFQAGLLDALSKLVDGRIVALSLRSLTAFPRGTPLFSRGSSFHLNERCLVHVVPFFNVAPVKPFFQGGALALDLFRLWRRRFRPDAILVYNPFLRHSLLALTAGRLWRIPVVAIVGDADPPKPLLPKCNLHQIRRRLHLEIGHYFSGLIVLSSRVAEDFYPGQPTLKMEGGVNEDLVNRGNRRNPPVPGTIFYSGDLAVYCGVQLLLDAFALLEGEKYELWLTGRGPLQGTVEQAAKHDPRIRYFGFVSRAEYLDMLEQAKVLVNPRLSSRPESPYNFPSKLLEYLASGRLVISTASSDLEEEYGDKVFLLREETPEALARLIEDVCDRVPAELEAVGARGRAYMLAHKTWRAQSGRVYDFLATLAKSRGKEP